MSMFIQTEDDKDPPITLLIQGGPKVGKTHFAPASAPEPVFVLDTEDNAKVVVRKLQREGRDVRRVVCHTFADVKAAVAEAVKQKAGTIVFDSASDLQGLSEAAYLAKSGLKKVFPLVNFKHVFGPLDELLAKIRRAGMHCVLTCREKDEWVDDEKTGRMVFEGYKRFPYLANLFIRLAWVRAKGEKEPRLRALVLRNGFSMHAPRELSEINWPGMVRELVDVPEPQQQQEASA